MNAVIVDGDVAYPATSGKRLRTLHLMLRLAQRHRITYLGRNHGDAKQNRLATEYLTSHGIETKIFDDPIPRKQGLGFYTRLVGNLFSRYPYSVTSHFSERFRAAVAEHVARHPVDLIQLEWSGYLYTLPDKRIPVVLQAPNVDSLIWQRYHEAEKNPLKRWYIRRQWRKFLTFEAEAFHSVRHVVAVTLEDAALARELFHLNNIEVIDNGVDVASFANLRPHPDSRAILYLGSLDWRPNLDALDLLLESIFPAVRALVPEAKLLVVGRAPSDQLRKRLAEQPGVELHADVPDVRPFLEASAVLAVPLRIGGGSRLKILEALAAGLPVVASRVGAEGLILRPGQEYIQANSPEEFTHAILHCLNQPKAARRQAEQGRRSVTERYDWSSLAERLERVWEKVRAGE